MNFSGAYCYFCDDNNLVRIYADRETELANLDRMAAALLQRRAEVLARRDDCGCKCCKCSSRGEPKGVA